MSVKRSEILKSEVFKYNRSISSYQKSEPGLDHTDKPCDRFSDQRNMKKDALDTALRLNIFRRRTEIGKCS